MERSYFDRCLRCCGIGRGLCFLYDGRYYHVGEAIKQGKYKDAAGLEFVGADAIRKAKNTHDKSRFAENPELKKYVIEGLRAACFALNVPELW